MKNSTIGINFKKAILLFCILFFFSGQSFSCSNQDNLTDIQLKNLVTFSQLYGYVKFFYPSKEARDINWDALASYGAREVLKAYSVDEAQSILLKIFSPIAPSLQICKDCSDFSKDDAPKSSENFTHVYWKHFGYGLKHGDNVYYSYVKNMDSIVHPYIHELYYYYDNVQADDYVKAVLFNGLNFYMPIALPYNGENTFPISDEAEGVQLKKELFEEFKKPFAYDDKPFLLGDIIIAWNVLKYFYPYYDIIDEKLSDGTVREEYLYELLESSLISAYDDNNEQEFFNTLSMLVASLNDGHGNVYCGTMKPGFYLPFKVGWVQDSVIVTKVFDSLSSGIKYGDIILKINDKSVYEIINEKEKLISSSTPQWKKLKIVEQELLKGERDSAITVDVLREGSLISQVSISSVFTQEYFNSGTKNPKFITKDILYVDLSGSLYEDFQKQFGVLSNAKGVIFDLRGYPTQSAWQILQHLTKDTILSPIFEIPVITKPNLSEIKYGSLERWKLPPAKPFVNAKVVFLTDAHAISYAETIMAIVENYKLGTIIGSPTAGTNGNVNILNLPGEFSVVWTGMKVLKHDGSQYHGIGVHPDILIEKTINGVKQNRDEVLERAIEYIQ